MANILTIITAVLAALGVKIPGCLGVSDPNALQRYATRIYNPRQNEYRPGAMRMVIREAKTAADNAGKAASYEELEQLAHCTLDALRSAKPSQVQRLMESAPTGVSEADPIALAAAQSAVDYGVTVEDQ